jgi:H+/Cl- antiporter ClcA
VFGALEQVINIQYLKNDHLEVEVQLDQRLPGLQATIMEEEQELISESSITEPPSPFTRVQSGDALDESISTPGPSSRTLKSKAVYADFSTIDWARDTVRESRRQKSLRHDAKSSPWGLAQKVFDDAQGWIVMCLVGIAAGFAAGCIDIGASWLQDIKEGICPKAFWLNRLHCCWAEDMTGRDDCENWYRWSEFSPNATAAGGYAANYFVFIIFATIFAWLAAVLVRRLAPYATGSGIPEVKTILSGFIIRGYFGWWTLVVKSVGLILSVSSGLNLGKEGPLVHVACCCGNVLSRLFPKYRHNEAKKREVLSAAAAAGVSVAFGAPVGGVLFSLEEVSYYFPHRVMWRAFFCALVAAAMLGTMNPFISGRLVKFYVSYDNPWHWFELFPFIFLGALGVRRATMMLQLISGRMGCVFHKIQSPMVPVSKILHLGTVPDHRGHMCRVPHRPLQLPQPIHQVSFCDATPRFLVVEQVIGMACCIFRAHCERMATNELISSLFGSCAKDDTSALW